MEEVGALVVPLDWSKWHRNLLSSYYDALSSKPQPMGMDGVDDLTKKRVGPVLSSPISWLLLSECGFL